MTIGPPPATLALLRKVRAIPAPITDILADYYRAWEQLARGSLWQWMLLAAIQELGEGHREEGANPTHGHLPPSVCYSPPKMARVLPDSDAARCRGHRLVPPGGSGVNRRNTSPKLKGGGRG